MNRNRDKYDEIGMNGHITKPCSLADLEAELARVMEGLREDTEQDLSHSARNLAS